MKVLSPRAASIAACLTDAFVAPNGFLPPVRDTDAIEAFDAALAAGPRANRVGLRLLLYALELAPLLAGEHHRLRRLPADRRRVALTRLEATPGGMLLKAVRGLAHVSYYGDLAVMRRLGYDPEANLARARAIRAKEGRRW